jgi:hypothetical protein
MMFAGTDNRWQPRPGEESRASLAISGVRTEGWLATEAEPATWKRNPDKAGDALRKSLKDSAGKLYAVEASGRPFEFPYELAVPKLAALGRSAGNGIAYATLGSNDEGRRVRDVFDRLADEVIQRMHL